MGAAMVVSAYLGHKAEAMACSNKIVVAMVHSTNAKSTLVGWRLKEE